MSNVIIDKTKIDLLANAIADKSGESITMTLDEMVEAVDGIEVGGGEPMLQSKTFTAGDYGMETITADSGYDGLSSVNVVVPAVTDLLVDSTSGYIDRSGVRKYYFLPFAESDKGGWVRSGQAYQGSVFYLNAVPVGTSVTPTETAQYIGGNNVVLEDAITVSAIPSTYVGSGVTQRSSSDLTASGATITVPSGYYSAQASKAIPSATYVGVTSVPITNTLSVTNDGEVRSHVEVGGNISPIYQGGYASPSDTVPFYISGSETLQLSTQAATTITPTTSAQTAVAAGKYTTGAVTVAAMPSGTAGTPTATKGSVSNHSISVTPSVTNTTGYITGGTKTGTAVSVSASELVSGTVNITSSGNTDVTNYATASVASGSATVSATKGTVSNHSVTVTPSVTRTAGYITAGSANGTAVTVSAGELVSGSQTISENGTVDVTNLASVTVSIPIVTYYTGSSAPSSSLGSNGDIYLQS